MALLLCLAISPAQAQPASCIDTASDRQSFNECAQREILPLEARVVQLVNGLRSRYRNDPGRLAPLEASEDAWNAYRNNHCRFESLSRTGAAEVETQRVFAACTRRALELRIKELEGLR